MSLTNLTIKSAKPTGKAYKLFDVKGLYLLISPIGAKTWRYKYSFGGREKALGLGQYPAVGLAEARERHAIARKQYLDGLDPSVEALREKLQRKREARATFEIIAEEWIVDNTPRWSQSHADRVRHRLERDL